MKGGKYKLRYRGDNIRNIEQRGHQSYVHVEYLPTKPPTLWIT